MGCSLPGAAYLSALAIPAETPCPALRETVKVTWDKSGPRFSKVAESHRKIMFKGIYSLE